MGELNSRSVESASSSASVNPRPNCPAVKHSASSLATELQRAQRGSAMYVLDEPTTGLHPSDVDKLMKQLTGLLTVPEVVVKLSIKAELA